ncbi:hypothetical protein QBC42DRAFT_257304 [Cladorrhinum samala]|uniref:Uncharacterized protein n=1 Tax=Cladorrhinum samala TaxID=585594 RepID=A0AAV9H5V1_9PEZI|nr:hypothetical protein QBC42DRAFT_257304 [Cladorrhinum samala]
MAKPGWWAIVIVENCRVYSRQWADRDNPSNRQVNESRITVREGKTINGRWGKGSGSMAWTKAKAKQMGSMFGTVQGSLFSVCGLWLFFLPGVHVTMAKVGKRVVFGRWLGSHGRQQATGACTQWAKVRCRPHCLWCTAKPAAGIDWVRGIEASLCFYIIIKSKKLAAAQRACTLHQIWTLPPTSRVRRACSISAFSVDGRQAIPKQDRLGLSEGFPGSV